MANVGRMRCDPVRNKRGLPFGGGRQGGNIAATNRTKEIKNRSDPRLRRPRARSVPSLHAAKPVVDVLLHLILGVTIASLQLALQLLAVAIDLREVIIGQL